MQIEQRLARCKQYLAEALEHPRANKLYIEDLQLSIEMFEVAAKNNGIISGKSWVDSEET